MTDPKLADLTDYQLKFVDEYMKCGDKKKALIAAGYSGKGKHSTLVSMAHQMFKKPNVYAEIERRRRELAERNIISAEQIVSRLTKMFNGELKSDFVTKKGEVVEVPITFKNQIEAAKVLVNIMGLQLQQSKQTEKTKEEKLSDEMKQMTESLLAAQKEIKAKKKLDTSKAEDAAEK